MALLEALPGALVYRLGVEADLRRELGRQPTEEEVQGVIEERFPSREPHPKLLGEYLDHQRLDALESAILDATATDLSDLLAMAEEFVREGRRDLVWGPRTAALYEGVFSGLIADPDGGALVLARGRGFAVAADMPHETPWGRAAMGFGIYVRETDRGLGLGRQLHLALLGRLAARGYDALVTGSDTAAGAMILSGMEPVSSYGVIHLGGS